MQLRVARLCLDCEELFVGESCPICASERHVFLTTWLPVEERRRWRRPARRPAQASGRFRAFRRTIARWLGMDEPWLAAAPPDAPAGPRTRTSDFVPPFDFGEERKPPEASPSLDAQPARNDTR
jgi:hypothetical protein